MNATCGNLDHMLVDVYFSMKEHFVCRQNCYQCRVLTYFYIMKQKIICENPLFLYNMK